jgi:hypothetical protein
MSTDQPRPGADGQPTDESSAAFLRAMSAHPNDMARLVEELHRPVLDEDSLIDLMHRTSREAVRMLVDVHWAGVTAQFAGPPFTAASTNRRVMVVDEGQYGQGDGPCLQALRTDRPVSMTSEQVAERWPVLAEAVRVAGVRSFHAEPLHARRRPVGCLNLYSGRAGEPLRPDPDVLTVLTGYLDRGLTDYSATQPGEPDAHRLQEALRTRFVVNQAIGVLMAAHGITAEQARVTLLNGLVEAGDLEEAARQTIARYTVSEDAPMGEADPADGASG